MMLYINQFYPIFIFTKTKQNITYSLLQNCIIPIQIIVHEFLLELAQVKFDWSFWWNHPEKFLTEQDYLLLFDNKTYKHDGATPPVIKSQHKILYYSTVYDLL
jgi:hypothetical protein